MATLHDATLKKKRRKKAISYFLLMGILMALSPLIIECVDGALNGILKDFGNFNFNFNYFTCAKLLLNQQIRQIILAAFLFLFTCFYLLTTMMATPAIGSTATKEVATGISIPVAVGNGQHGTARFMKKPELDETFEIFEYKRNGKIKPLPKSTGIIINYEQKGGKETIHFLTKPSHAIIIGATRAGKTRRLLLPSIWLDIMAGVSMCITDAKGEIYAYTCEFAEDNGYQIITMDLRTPEKSMHHNYMVDVVEKLKQKDVTEAIDKTWDLVSVLVGEAKGERIWNDGECSAIAAAILIVAEDAPESCKNLTNVYYFLAYMCETDELGDMPINRYISMLPDNHPAKSAFQVAKIAPFRTRASFFTSALATLRHFTNYKIADMTKASDYSMADIDSQKTIIYLMVPDEKTTLYGLGSLYINQLYIALVEQANKNGGRLNRKFIFRCDEFGNFPIIPGMGPKMSAGAGRNIFFELVLQDYQQLESKYKEDFGNIKANAQLTLYLKTTDEKTLEELSKKCGNYTVQVNSSSTSQNDGKANNLNYSVSANMTGRPLLFPDEIGKIDSPDALALMGGKYPAIVNLPDLEKYHANQEMGLGDVEFNQRIYLERHGKRESREVGPSYLWGIWNEFVDGEQEEPKDEKVSFL